MAVGGISAAFGFFSLLFAPLSPPWVRYTLNGDVVGGREFVSELGVLAWIALLILMGAFCVITMGIYRERPWVRLWLLRWIAGLFAVGAALAARTETQDVLSLIGSTILGAAIIIGATYWYLYQKKNVAQYFATLQDEIGTRSDNAAPY